MLESAKTASLLIKLDVADKANQKGINSVDLEFGIKYELKRLIDSKKVTSIQVFHFKKRQWCFWQVFAAMHWKKVHFDLCFQGI